MESIPRPRRPTVMLETTRGLHGGAAQRDLCRTCASGSVASRRGRRRSAWPSLPSKIGSLRRGRRKRMRRRPTVRSRASCQCARGPPRMPCASGASGCCRCSRRAPSVCQAARRLLQGRRGQASGKGKKLLRLPADAQVQRRQRGGTEEPSGVDQKGYRALLPEQRVFWRDEALKAAAAADDDEEESGDDEQDGPA